MIFTFAAFTREGNCRIVEGLNVHQAVKVGSELKPQWAWDGSKFCKNLSTVKMGRKSKGECGMAFQGWTRFDSEWSKYDFCLRE